MMTFRTSFLPLVFLLSFMCSVFAQNLEGEKELGACGICTMAVNTLEGYISKAVSEDDLLKELSAVSKTVCENVPTEILSKEKCTSFVTLYAPYIVELLYSNAKSQEICSDLGLCDSESNKYQILFPIIENGIVMYSAIEQNYKTESQFNYKIFLGNPQFLDNETYTLIGSVSNISGTEINLKITDRSVFVMNDNCRDKTRCVIDVTKPGKKVWYYISVNVKVTAENPSFTLDITEQNIIPGHWEYRGSHGSNLTFIFVIFACIIGLCSICLAITRCMFYQRNSNPGRKLEDIEESLIERRIPAFVEPIDHTPMVVFLSPNNVPMIYPSEQYIPYTVTHQ